MEMSSTSQIVMISQKSGMPKIPFGKPNDQNIHSIISYFHQSR